MKSEKKNNSNVKKRLHGIVVSDAMRGSVVVRVERYVKHPTYGKYMRKQKNYTVDDPGNKHKIDDKVTIEESRPISKTKHFRILRNEYDE